MKTAEDRRIEIFNKIEPLLDMNLPPMIFMPAVVEAGSFIENQFAEHDAELAEKIKEMKRKDILDDPYKDGYNEALTEVLNLLESK